MLCNNSLMSGDKPCQDKLGYTGLLYKGYKSEYFNVHSYVSSLATWVQLSVCSTQEGLHQSTPLLFIQPQSNLTIIHCGPSQKSTSPVPHGLNSTTQKQCLLWGGGIWRQGGCGALFVMLISWPNLNDPDICWPACVKPHIQFVPQIQKADKTLEAGKNVCVCVSLLLMLYGWERKILLFQCMY